MLTRTAMTIMTIFVVCNETRHWCGAVANPPGVFFSFIADGSTFFDIPMARNQLFAEANVRVHAFISVEPDHTAIQLSATLENILATLLQSFQRFEILLQNASAQYLSLLSQYSQHILAILIDEVIRLKELVEDTTSAVINFKVPQLSSFLDKFNNIWGDGWRYLEGNTTLFVDSVRNKTRILPTILVENIEQEKTILKTEVLQSIETLTIDLMTVLSDAKGFGLRFLGGIDILDIKIVGLEMELVYSLDALGQCSKFKQVYSLLEDENSIRFIGTISTELLFPIKLHPLIKLDPDIGVGIGGAFSVNGTFVLQTRVEVTMLGVKGETDIFITNRRLYWYTETNVWDVFRAQITVYAEHDGTWTGLSFGVDGKFVADADGDGNFQDSYLSAMKRFIQKLSDDAERRISDAQDLITTTQDNLSEAQDLLDDKKADVDKANGAFDSAIQKLEAANSKLEEAKGPFQNAVDELKDAQRKVDNLCKIKTCKKICIPGIRLTICWKKAWFIRIPYPCFKFTNCMISFPDPICVVANLLCQIVRAAAYLVLEAAKIFVKIPMLALDLAKSAVSAAHFVVDKSRVVLDIAKAALDMAKLGLEVTKSVLSAAKEALEAVKYVVKLGLSALSFIVQYGILGIIDVRNCGFEVQVSTHDKPVFDVRCEINAFKSGWKTVRIRINFTDIVQSIWNAAKATIEAALKSIGDIFSGRKRREIQHQAVKTLYTVLRERRETNDFSDIECNETLNVISNIVGFQNISEGTSYDFRREVFENKCVDFNLVNNFFSDAIHVLKEISNETVSTFDHITGIFDSLDYMSIDNSMTELTFDDLGIDAIVAANEFNISIDELRSLINEGKKNLTDNEYLNNIQTTSSEAKQLLQYQMDDANNMNLVNHWILMIENQTFDYFDSEICVSFLDCVLYSISVLYEMVEESEFSYQIEYLDRVSDLEDAFLNLTGSQAHTIINVNAIAGEIEDHLMYLKENNVFCSTPPVMLAPLENVTLYTGQTLQLTCNATADPIPTFTWYKADQIVDEHTDMVLLIDDVDVDNTGWYHCVAGNIVANFTFQQIYVDVIELADDTKNGTTVKTTQEDGDDTSTIIVAAVSTGGVVAVIILAVGTARYIRASRMRRNRVGSISDKRRLHGHQEYNDRTDTSYNTKLRPHSRLSVVSTKLIYVAPAQKTAMDT